MNFEHMVTAVHRWFERATLVPHRLICRMALALIGALIACMQVFFKEKGIFSAATYHALDVTRIVAFIIGAVLIVVFLILEGLARHRVQHYKDLTRLCEFDQIQIREAGESRVNQMYTILVTGQGWWT